MNLTGVQGCKARHLPPTFEVEENDTRETRAKVEGHGYWDTDGPTRTCCFCCGISTHTLCILIGSTVIPVDVVMVSHGLALGVFKNCNVRLHCQEVNRKKLALT